LREGESVLDLLTAAIASGADFEKTTEEGKSALEILGDEFRNARKEEFRSAGYKYKIRVFDEFCGEIERVFGRKSNAGERARANAHLMMAARWGNAEQVKRALAKADVDAGSESGFTSLMFAVFNDKSESAKCLIDGGADLEAKNAAGETALIVATRCGESVSSVETLIRAGANTDAADNEGYTALMRLCKRACEWYDKWYTYAENYAEYTGYMRALVDAGANVNARNANGQTALMMAANEFSDVIKMSKILVKAGADVNARDNFGRTALSIARRNRKRAIERFLVSAGARADETETDENYFPDAALKLRDCGVEI
jgi:ankyrin repeat protein